jgi:hypothetical protein
MYKQSAGQGGGDGAGGPPPAEGGKDDVIDAEFEDKS